MDGENLHPTLEDIKKMMEYLCINTHRMAEKATVYAQKMHNYAQNPFDMFPWTGHVECCVLLYRKDYKVGGRGKKVTVEVGMNK